MLLICPVAVWGEALTNKVIQWHRFLLSVQELCERRMGVQWATEWKMWRIAQRGSAGDEPGETGGERGGGGELALSADEMSKWREGLMLCSGKGVVEAFTYPTSPLHPYYSQPKGRLPWQQNLSLFFFFFSILSLTTKPEVSCSLQQLFRCYLWQHIRCTSPAVSIRGVFIALRCVTRELVCGGNTHINNLSGRFRRNLQLAVVWIVAALLPRWALAWEIHSLNVKTAISLISSFII